MYHGDIGIPNPTYFCDRCHKNLGSKWDHLRGNSKAKTIFTTLEGKTLCQRCFCRGE